MKSEHGTRTTDRGEPLFWATVPIARDLIDQFGEEQIRVHVQRAIEEAMMRLVLVPKEEDDED